MGSATRAGVAFSNDHRGREAATAVERRKWRSTPSEGYFYHVSKYTIITGRNWLIVAIYTNN
jgi:hypothetical protein